MTAHALAARLPRQPLAGGREPVGLRLPAVALRHELRQLAVQRGAACRCLTGQILPPVLECLPGLARQLGPHPAQVPMCRSSRPRHSTRPVMPHLSCASKRCRWPAVLAVPVSADRPDHASPILSRAAAASDAASRASFRTREASTLTSSRAHTLASPACSDPSPSCGAPAAASATRRCSLASCSACRWYVWSKLSRGSAIRSTALLTAAFAASSTLLPKLIDPSLPPDRFAGLGARPRMSTDRWTS
jgi:hypothetical protein